MRCPWCPKCYREENGQCVHVQFADFIKEANLWNCVKCGRYSHEKFKAAGGFVPKGAWASVMFGSDIPECIKAELFGSLGAG